MKNAELRQMNATALEEQLLLHKSELAKFKSLRASGTKSEKPSQIRASRRLIARVLTILAEKKANKAAIAADTPPVPKAATPLKKSTVKKTDRVAAKKPSKGE